LITRRELLKLLAEGAVVLGALRVASLIPATAESKILRPPGAVNEAYFNLLCIRCGICLQVCPTKTIVLSGFENGVHAVNTPKINSLIGPCEFYRGQCEEVMRCGKYCPTGALSAIDKMEVKLGEVDFNSRTCWAYEGKECLICAEMCPVPGAITEKDRKPVFHLDKCVGCGTCVYVCPAVPKALALVPNGIRRVQGLRRRSGRL
jgi:ferredoxin-type protein NapG